MNAHTPTTRTWAARMLRNTFGLMAWSAAWAVTLALAKFGPSSLWNHELTPTVLAIAFNLLVGVGMLMANKRHLQCLDELQRTTQLHAMAWALGAGLVGGMTGVLLDHEDLIDFDVEIAHLVMLMAAVYMVGTFVGWRRYR